MRHAAGGRPLVISHGAGPLSYQAAPPFFCFLAPFFSYVVNSFLIRYSTCHPSQTLPKNFKHPKLLIRRSKNYEICTHAKLTTKRIFEKNSKILKIV
jgi:hypothetical protein